MRRARTAVRRYPASSQAAIVLEPTLDRDVAPASLPLLVDQREQDPDAITAAVAERLWDVVGAKPEAESAEPKAQS